MPPHVEYDGTKGQVPRKDAGSICTLYRRDFDDVDDDKLLCPSVL